MIQPNSLNKEFDKYDSQYENSDYLKSIVSIHTDSKPQDICIRRTNKRENEQYYKWKLIYALVFSGMYPKENIGTEVHFPKGNKSSAPLKIDVAIFDNDSWFSHYNEYWNSKGKNLNELEWLQNHLIVAIEIKQEDGKGIQEVWDKQLKAYMKESARDFCLGILYDTDRLYLFQKRNGKFVRYNESKNENGFNSKSSELNLLIPDPFYDVPSLEFLLAGTKRPDVDLSNRTINDLSSISSLQSTAINVAMQNILRTMSENALIDQRGYNILIQTLALKIYDEKNNERYRHIPLKLYIQEDEFNYKSINDDGIQNFIARLKGLEQYAKGEYKVIFSQIDYDTHKINHVNVLANIVYQLQDYSFVKSQKTDLYQIIFYQFANKFATENNAQFITPIPIVQFIVDLVNPRSNETVIDPTCGISDFLSVSYVSSRSRLNDKNMYGMDLSPNMVILSTLNMLLNGDGNANLQQVDGLGSVSNKFCEDGTVTILDVKKNKKGEWNNERADGKKYKLFDVVLTNPPFGKNRAFSPKKDSDKEFIECYELWHEYNSKSIDYGVVFLENAYRILNKNGRMGIILSNSIASIDTHKKARQWLLDHMRIVALIDLPPGVFAETDVNTTIIIAYKPSESELASLKNSDYEIFIRDIKNVGYEVVTSQRVKKFVDKFKVDHTTFKYVVDENGELKKDEDFSQTISDFRSWCNGQEKIVRDLFVKEK